uniref:Uncharacterized protein n=1 Tax=Amphimedon queenslandica TaxID=400682 RepID=A0A1X7SXG3_AMPQE
MSRIDGVVAMDSHGSISKCCKSIVVLLAGLADQTWLVTHSYNPCMSLYVCPHVHAYNTIREGPVTRNITRMY